MSWNRSYYRKKSRVLLIWQNIGLGLLALIVLGIVGYMVLTQTPASA